MGAGRPKMNAVEKERKEALHGRKRNTQDTIVDFSDGKELPATPSSWLDDSASKIYIEVRKWLKDMDCLKGILPRHLEGYAHLKSKWHDCEAQVKAVGMVIKDDGKMKANPYIQFGVTYQKQASEVWSHIYAVVRDSKTRIGGESVDTNDPMEKLLREMGH